MGWVGGTSWERAAFWRAEPFSAVPLDDDSAWLLFDRERWVYNKLQIAQDQGIVAHPCGVEVFVQPPYVTKPIMNLIGLSQGVEVHASYTRSAHDDKPGYFWQAMRVGPQYSHDVVMVCGQVVQIISTRCYRDPQRPGMFTAFEVDTIPPRGIQPAITYHLQRWLPEFTGPVNVETIGEVIIEAHLRPTTQWASLHGRQWPLAVGRAVDMLEWDFDPDTIQGGWSIPVYEKFDQTAYERAVQRGIEVHVTMHDKWHPPHARRTAVVNAPTEDDALETARALGVCHYQEGLDDAAHQEG